MRKRIKYPERRTEHSGKKEIQESFYSHKVHYSKVGNNNALELRDERLGSKYRGGQIFHICRF